MIPVYVLTNDKHLFLLKGFTACFRRFWPEQSVVVAGYHPPDEPLPEGFSFLSLGDVNPPADHWSDGLHRLLDHIHQPHFLLMLEDYWLYEAVDVEKIKSMFRLMAWLDKRHSEVLRLDLSGDRAALADHRRAPGSWETTPIIESLWNSPYQMSLQAAIWSKNTLRKYLPGGWSPWQFEVEGSETLSRLGPQGPKVYGVEQPLLRYQPVYRAGRNRWQTDKIPADVLAVVKAGGP